MAEKLKIQTLNIPSEVVDSDWRDDIDTAYATRDDASTTTEDFEFYGGNETQEGEYISPTKVSKESIDQIKDFQVKLAFNGLKNLRNRERLRLAAS